MCYQSCTAVFATCMLCRSRQLNRPWQCARTPYIGTSCIPLITHTQSLEPGWARKRSGCGGWRLLSNGGGRGWKSGFSDRKHVLTPEPACKYAACGFFFETVSPRNTRLKMVSAPWGVIWTLGGPASSPATFEGR